MLIAGSGFLLYGVAKRTYAEKKWGQAANVSKRGKEFLSDYRSLLSSFISIIYLRNLNLIIGTQKDDNYTLYYYNVWGGKPDGNPVRVISGEGKVKSMKYTDSGVDTMFSVPLYMD